MYRTPLLKAKLLIPGVPARSLYSQRIKNFDIAKNRLTVLVAPAGFGKTTSVLLALNRKREHVRWYRLEKEDILLPIFYRHLLETLFAGEENLMQDSLNLLNSVRNIEEDYLLLNAQICQDLSILLQDRKDKIYLVLDDYHNVAGNPSVRETVKYLLSNLPETMSVIITSRVDPQILTGKVALRSDVKQIEREDLLFTRQEAEQLIKEKYGLNLSKKQLDSLFRCSEGWITGLYMICHSMDFSDPCSYTEDELLRRGENRFSAFLGEFLQNLEIDKRSVLLRLSVLEDFSAEELKNILHVHDPASFIDWLENGNLYIQKIVGETARYRFHSLFANELEKLFKAEFTIEQQCGYFAELGEYYADLDIRMAVRFFLRGGMMEKVRQLVAEAGHEHFQAGSPEEMFRLLGEFPPEFIRQNPYLLVYQGMMNVNADGMEADDYFIRAIDLFRKNRDYSFLMNAFGMLLVRAFQTNNFQCLKDAAAQIPIAGVILGGGAGLAKLIISSFVSLTGEDKLRRSALLRRLIDRATITEEMWQYSYLMIRGISYYRSGRLREAEKTMHRILAHPVGLANDQWRIIGLVSCCNVPFLMGDERAMEDFSTEFFLLGEKYNSNFAMGYGYFISAHYKYQKGDVEGALKALDLSMEMYQNYGSEVLVRESEMIRLLWDEETPAAAALPKALENMRYFALESPGHGIAEFSQTVYGVLLKRNGQFREAESHLKKSLAISRRKGARQSMCGIWMQLADLYILEGDSGSAENHLKKWAAESVRHNYLYFRETDRGSAERVCRRAETIGETRAYCEKFSKTSGAYSPAKPFEETAGQELRIKLFGSFEINGDGFQIVEKDFKTKKVSGVLKYILTGESDRPIPREKLAAVFWPEAESKAAFTSLRVTLYELRKTLALFHIGPESEQAIIREAKDGFFVWESEGLKTDVREFEKGYAEWKRGGLSAEQTVGLLEEVCGLYQGTFLGDEPYDDRIMVMQTHYASMFTEAVHALSRQFMEAGFDDRAEKWLLRALTHDPLDESSCAMLLDIYRQTGQTDRATALQRRFIKKFTSDMGFPPTSL